MFSKKSDAPFPRHEFSDRLNSLLSAAERAGMTKGQLADIFERRAESMHRQVWRVDREPRPVRNRGSGGGRGRDWARPYRNSPIAGCHTRRHR